MKMHFAVLLSLPGTFVCIASGCGDASDGQPDATPADVGSLDPGEPDGEPTDGAVSDTVAAGDARIDAPSFDGSVADGGPEDGMTPDSVPADTPGADGASEDGSATDPGPADAPPCVDEDGDGYGVGCGLGPDCDDGAPGITGPCAADGCPQGWVLIPAGDFEMGCNQDETCAGDHFEPPRHTVTLSAFCISLTEVSVAEFRACKDAGVCTGTPEPTSVASHNNWSETASDREALPINAIHWEHSRAYCQDWVAGDLPSEAQWERAARGTDERKYPWGNTPEPDCGLANFNVNWPEEGLGCGSVTEGAPTWPVADPASGAGDSPHGLRNAAGNVWEWVLDCHTSDAYEQCASGCVDPVIDLDDCGAGSRGVRGGSVSDRVSWLRATARSSVQPLARYANVGLRCARPPAP